MESSLPLQTSAELYILEEALYKGDYSDVTINAFGKEYMLHKLFLRRSPVLKSLITWNKLKTDSGSEIRSITDKTKKNYYTIQSDDPYVTQESWELCLKRLYFNIDYDRETRIPFQMITIGKYLGMNDLIEDNCQFLLSIMSMKVVSACLAYFVPRQFGMVGDRMIERCKFYLLKYGWEQGPENWDHIPVSIICQVAGENSFFVPNEYDRAIFIIRLLERKIERSDDGNNVLALKELLDKGVYYYHIPVEKLRELEKYRDINGQLYISKDSIAYSVWERIWIFP
ncbi:unnamed protein product [Ambrosiozyma monospora]|uniref:Unnamed protein product n=1 Tax=Ambrosiozyma monospora TaxID=43982 RepID=A0A9W6Z8P9_AMBMO|nr:unnamed protein product [Ambrosiozyma monospora]